LKPLQKQLESVTATRTQAEAARNKLQQQAAALKKQLADDQQALVAAQSQEQTHWNDLIEQSTARCNVFGLSPLTPEQLALSMLVATGQYDRLRAAAQAKIDKEKPLTDEAKQDPTAVQA